MKQLIVMRVEIGMALVKFGAWIAGFGLRFQCYSSEISNIRIYGRALCQAEILRLYGQEGQQ